MSFIDMDNLSDGITNKISLPTFNAADARNITNMANADMGAWLLVDVLDGIAAAAQEGKKSISFTLTAYTKSDKIRYRHAIHEVLPELTNRGFGHQINKVDGDESLYITW